MVQSFTRHSTTVHACEECGLVYDEKALAEACQSHCETHDSCNLTIGRQAIGSTDVPD